MLMPLAQLLESSAQPVGAFTCYDATTAAGVAQAAEQHGSHAILLISEASLAQPSGRFLIPALLAVAARCDVPVCVQLDHATNAAIITSALAAGIGGVLADGSQLPYEENVAFVQTIVEHARATGASVEAELGHIAGGEDVAKAVAAGALTDPGEAGDFVGRTGCAVLAVSIGNVHGTYASPPSLDWQRLSSIRRAVATPLALHGASGLPDEMVRRAVAGGIRKLNVNTEIRARQLNRLRDSIEQVLPGYRMLDVQRGLAAAAQEVAGEVMQSLSAD